MFDLKNLDRWVRVGKAARAFGNVEPREVRLEVLAEEPTKLYVSHKGVSGQYIGTFEGYDVVKFHVPGEWTLTASGVAFVWTPELTGPLAVVIPDQVSFTRKMERRTRNPELEAMMGVMQRNMERRLAQVERDVTLKTKLEFARQREADEAARRGAAERDGDGGASEEDEDADEPSRASAAD